MKTYDVRTYGCQMNVHDSERLAGLLESAGYVDVASLPAGRPRRRTSWCSTPARCARTPTTSSTATSASCGRPRTRTPTCRSPSAAAWPRRTAPPSSTAAPWVDVVFGTHNIGSPAGPARPRRATTSAPRSRSSRAWRSSPPRCPPGATPPTARWVSISVGCNNTCTFCIVPSLRGKETDRRPGDILAEIEALVAQGVVEVTLLGQNVNTYGVEFGDRLAFGKLLRACGEIDGLERVRFTSPHPAAFTDDVIAAMAETPNVMPSLHMPLQSGLRPGAEGDAPLLPQRQVPRHPRPGPRADPGRRDHDRHHRRLPRRDRGGLRADPRGRARVPVRQRLHLPVLHPPRHAGGDDGRPGAQGRRAGALRAAASPCRRRSPGPENRAARGPRRSRCSSPRARAARTPRPSACPAGPATTGSCTSPCPRGPPCRVPVTWSGRRSPTARRTTSSPTPASRAGSTPCAAPAAATPGRPCRTRRSPVDPRSRSACRRSGVPRPVPHDAARLRLTGGRTC